MPDIAIFTSEGQLVADMTRRTLQSMRKEENFDLFWDKVKRMAEDKDVDQGRSQGVFVGFERTHLRTIAAKKNNVICT